MIEQHNVLQQLPNCFFHEVFPHLSEKEKLSIKTVCKNWKENLEIADNVKINPELKKIKAQYQELKKEHYTHHSKIYLMRIACVVGRFLDKKVYGKIICYPIVWGVSLLIPLAMVAGLVENVAKLIFFTICSNCSLKNRALMGFTYFKKINNRILNISFACIILLFKIVTFNIISNNKNFCDVFLEDIFIIYSIYPRFKCFKFFNYVMIVNKREQAVNRFFHHLLSIAPYKDLLDCKSDEIWNFCGEKGFNTYVKPPQFSSDLTIYGGKKTFSKEISLTSDEKRLARYILLVS